MTSRNPIVVTPNDIDQEDILSKTAVALFGFDTTKLNWRDQIAAESSARRSWEVEAELLRRNPKPKPKLSKAEELEERRLRMLEAKFEKIAGGRPVKELSNEDLEKQLKSLRQMVKK